MTSNFGVIIQKVETAHVVYFLDCRMDENAKIMAVKDKVLGFLEKLGEAPLLVMDMQRVDYLASMGLSMIAAIEKQVRKKGGKVVFCGAKPSLRELFRVTNMEKILTVVEDQRHAMALLHPPFPPAR